MADHLGGYFDLTDVTKTFLREMPDAWDITKQTDGQPCRDIFIVRQKGDAWYIGDINAEQLTRNEASPLSFKY